MSPEKLVASPVGGRMPGIVMAESGRSTGIVSCLLAGSWGTFNVKTVGFLDAALAAFAFRRAMCAREGIGGGRRDGPLRWGARRKVLDYGSEKDM